jgi:hypothetical protein
VEGHTFVASFFQHVASVRQVFNPLERDDVIGITNYIGVGIGSYVFRVFAFLSLHAGLVIYSCRLGFRG